jgi:hypothetical protein
MRSYLLVFLVLATALAPALAGATITSIFLQTSDNFEGVGSGLWATNGWAAIGVSLPGASDNPFLNSGLPLNVASGSYLLFLGYEDRFTNNTGAPGQISVVVNVGYSDSTSKQATFTNDAYTNSSLASASLWNRTAGNSSLVLGSSGITSADRVASDPAGTFRPNGVPDVVLEFSDTGTFNSPSSGVPEPGTIGLVLAGLAIGCLVKWGR